jgi:hypothetical protein
MSYDKKKTVTVILRSIKSERNDKICVYCFLAPEGVVADCYLLTSLHYHVTAASLIVKKTKIEKPLTLTHIDHYAWVTK